MSIRDKCARLVRSPGRLATGLLALTLTAASAIGLTAPTTVQAAVAEPAAAQPAAVPAPPAGFTTTWSDDFTGAANTGLDTGTWRYDAGPGCSFGTGEIETMTNSTANVYQDGNGHLVLKALHSGTDPNSGWTSGRVETQADGFGAPPGGVVRMQASIQQPNLTTANGAGYWPAFWMLGSPLRIGAGVAGLRRGRHPGGHQRPQLGVRHAALRRQPRRPVQRVDRHRQRRARLLRLPDRLPHLRASRSTAPPRPSRSAGTSTARNYFTVNSNQVDATTWANAVDHASSSSSTWRWAAASRRRSAAAPTPPPSSGGPDEHRLRRRLQQGAGRTSIGDRTSPRASRPPRRRPRARTSRRPTPPTATSPPAGPARSATRSGCRSTSASATTSATSTLNWEAAYAHGVPDADLQPTAPTGQRSTPTTTVRRRHPGHTRLTGTGRYMRVYGTQRASAYGYSLYELAVYGTPRGGGGTGGTLLSQGKTATASSHRERRLPGRRTPSTATPAPAGRAPSATRSGSRSTSAPRTPSARS